MNKNFLREFFGIPRKYELLWAVIVEKNKDGSKSCRLGLLLKGTNKAVDVMKRKFIQAEILEPVKRMTYPAKKSTCGGYVQFDTKDPDVHETVRVNKGYLDVEYFTAKYSPELMDTFLF